jgi:hypothetical protein
MRLEEHQCFTLIFDGIDAIALRPLALVACSPPEDLHDFSAGEMPTSIKAFSSRLLIHAKGKRQSLCSIFS